jgi:integrase
VGQRQEAGCLESLHRLEASGCRDRVLNDKELRAVWLAAGELGHPYTGIVRLLMVTGQRRSEIADLRWSEIDIEERALRLPASRTKNGRPHEVPLSPAALTIIAGLPRLVEADFFSQSGGDQSSLLAE